MNILICPDSFKGSISAIEAAKIIASVYDKDMQINCRLIPLADGGEGSIEIIKTQVSCSQVNLMTLNPLGTLVNAFYLQIDDTAYIDIANAGGLNLLKETERNPRITNTYGTGQLIADAIAKQCKLIVLFLGGSATIDGGLGLIQGICGAQFKQTNPLLSDDYIKLPEFELLIQNVAFNIVTDVSNTIIGEHGAAQVFGPQKGANNRCIIEIERAMERWLIYLQNYTTVDLKSLKGLGAAGGAALPFIVFNKQTRLIDGFNFFNELLDYKTAIKWADVVITGEGRIDDQTEMGKGPGQIALMGKQAGKKVIGIGGMVKSQPAGFNAVFATTDKALSEDELYLQAKKNLLKTSLKVRNYLLNIRL